MIFRSLGSFFYVLADMDSDSGKHRCFQSRNVRPAPALFTYAKRSSANHLRHSSAHGIELERSKSVTTLLNWAIIYCSAAISRWYKILYHFSFFFHFVHVSCRPSPVFSPCCWPSPSNEMTDGHFSYSYVGKWPKAVYISVARRRQAPETIPYITCRLGRSSQLNIVSCISCHMCYLLAAEGHVNITYICVNIVVLSRVQIYFVFFFSDKNTCADVFSCYLIANKGFFCVSSPMPIKCIQP